MLHDNESNLQKMHIDERAHIYNDAPMTFKKKKKIV